MNKGVMIQLKPNINEQRCDYNFNTDWLSDFNEEHEYLFAFVSNMIINNLFVIPFQNHSFSNFIYIYSIRLFKQIICGNYFMYDIMKYDNKIQEILSKMMKNYVINHNKNENHDDDDHDDDDDGINIPYYMQQLFNYYVDKHRGKNIHLIKSDYRCLDDIISNNLIQFKSNNNKFKLGPFLSLWKPSKLKLQMNIIGYLKVMKLKISSLKQGQDMIGPICKYKLNTNSNNQYINFIPSIIEVDIISLTCCICIILQKDKIKKNKENIDIVWNVCFNKIKHY